MAYYRSGQMPKAVADYSEAIRLDPATPLYRSNRAEAHFQLGQWKATIDDAGKAIEMAPRNPVHWNLRGNGWFRSGEMAKAIDDYSEAIRLNPGDPVVWDNRGAARAGLRQWDSAIADHSKAIEIQPRNASFRARRAQALGEAGRWVEALEDQTQAATLESKNADYWNFRGICHLRLGRFRDGLADFSRAIEIDAKNPICLRNRGATHAELAEWDLACADYVKALDLDSRILLYWWEYALLRASRGDQDGNRRACAKALDLFADSDNPETAASLVQISLRVPDSLVLEDYALVEDLVNRVVARHPDRSQYPSAAGLLSYRMSQFVEAAARLEEAMKGLKSDARIDAGLVLAMAYHRLGRMDEAHDELKRGRQQVEKARAETPRGPDGGIRLSWPQRLGHDLLLRQAEGLIGAK